MAVHPPVPINHSGAHNDAHVVELWLLGRPEQSLKSYRFDAEKFLEAVKKPLWQLTVADVGAWIESLEGSNGYKRRRLTTIKSLLRFSYDTGYHVYNVGKVIRLPRVKRRVHERLMERSTADGMAAEARPGRDRTLLRFFFASGCRVSESVGLNWADITRTCTTPGMGLVTVFGKGGKTRTVPVSLKVLDEMLALRGPSDGPDAPVFKSQRGRRLSVRDAQRITAAARTDVDQASPHWFRHCHAITALDGGCLLPELQSQLGHERLSTTGIYVHVRLGNGSANYIPF